MRWDTSVTVPALPSRGAASMAAQASSTERQGPTVLPAFRWTPDHGVQDLPEAPWTGPQGGALSAEAVATHPWR